MGKWLKGLIGGLVLSGLCASGVYAATGTKIKNSDIGNSLQERVAKKIGDQMDSDGSWTDFWLGDFQVRTFAIDDATPDVGTGTVFLINGSNTAATNVTGFDNLTAGKVFFIVPIVVGGTNQTTIGTGTNNVLSTVGTYTAAVGDIIAFYGSDTTTAIEMFRTNNAP